jgi:anti-sigma regulatory factor (Ser/Thr protein kinase)
MSTHGWQQVAPPDVGHSAGEAWDWEIRRPVELTRARTDLRARLGARSLPDLAGTEDVDRLLLMFEELASNGLRHGGTPIRVRVTATDDGWLVDVSDARPDAPPVPAVERDPAQGGLGLHLVARLSARYGWAVVGSRKHVWASLGRSRRR